MSVEEIIYNKTGSLPVYPKAPSKVYTVKRNDDLMRIAKNYGISPSAILRANNVTRIRPGMKLVIPRDNLYQPPKNYFNNLQKERARKRKAEDWGIPKPPPPPDYESMWGYVNPAISSPIPGSINQSPFQYYGPGAPGSLLQPVSNRPLYTSIVDKLLEQGIAPLVISSYDVKRLGLDPELLRQMYIQNEWGDWVRRAETTPAATPGAAPAVGKGSRGKLGNKIRAPRRRGGGEETAETAGEARTGMGFAGGETPYYFGGYGGYGQMPINRGVSPTGRPIMGSSGLITWRI